MKKKTFWAVMQGGELLYRASSGQMSIFKDKSLADFLAYDWADPDERLTVVKIKIEIIKQNEETKN